jgi:hypothetical protein
MHETPKEPSQDEEEDSPTEKKNSIIPPKYKSWKLNSGSKFKTSTHAKSFWKQDNNRRPTLLKRSFSLNSKMKEKDLKFQYSFDKNKSVVESLDKSLPKEMQVRVKDSKGKIIDGINVPEIKKKSKKKPLFWKIGDMVIYRRKEEGPKENSGEYIPVKYELYDSKKEIRKFSDKFDLNIS